MPEDPRNLLVIGRTVGHFRIESPLGAGGMGEVWLAWDLELERRVALKFMQPHLAADPGARQRFVREARALAALDHPAVGAVHGVEEDAGRPFMVLAFVEGQSLTALLRGGRLDPERARMLALRMAEGLAAVHARGIVHRDLKTDNVVVGAGDLPKIVDFGIALSAHDTRYTQTGFSPGTPGYTAPEVLRGGDADARADLFALGVMLYQMVTGRLPFAHTNAMAVMHAVVNEPTPPFPADLPPEALALEPVTQRLLEKDPERRFADADAVARALRGGLAAVPPLPSAPRVPPRAGARAPRWRAAAILLGVLALVVAAALVLLRPGHRRADVAGTPALLPRSVAVLPFDNLTGDTTLAWMSQGIAELLATALTQSESLDVFDARRLAELDVTSKPGAVAAMSLDLLRRRGIARAIAGSVLRSGDHLRIQGRLLDVGSGRTLQGRSVDGRVGGDLFELVGNLLPALQVALEVNLTGNREAEAWLRELTTNSVDAYRYFLQGHEALLASRWTEADRLYGRAVALDSNFVNAHVEQLGARWNMADLPAMAETRRQLARLRPRADEHARLQIDLMEAVVDLDSKKLIRSAIELGRVYPENRFYRYLLGRGFYTDSQYVRCIETLNPLRAQRYTWSWTYVLTARSFEHTGHPDSAQAAFELGYEVTRHDPELAFVYAVWLGQHGQRERRHTMLQEALKDERLEAASASQVHLELAIDADAAGDSAGVRSEIGRALALAPPGSDERGEIDKWIAGRAPRAR